MYREHQKGHVTPSAPSYTALIESIRMTAVDGRKARERKEENEEKKKKKKEKDEITHFQIQANGRDVVMEYLPRSWDADADADADVDALSMALYVFRATNEEKGYIEGKGHGRRCKAKKRGKFRNYWDLWQVGMYVWGGYIE